MNEETKSAASTGGVQQSQKHRGQSREEISLNTARQKRVQIKEGHLTGGYCDSEALIEVEKEIYKALSQKLTEAKERHGYSADPRFKHKEIRDIEVELNGLSYKPKLIAAND